MSITTKWDRALISSIIGSSFSKYSQEDGKIIVQTADKKIYEIAIKDPSQNDECLHVISYENESLFASGNAMANMVYTPDAVPNAETTLPTIEAIQKILQCEQPAAIEFDVYDEKLVLVFKYYTAVFTYEDFSLAAKKYLLDDFALHISSTTFSNSLSVMKDNQIIGIYSNVIESSMYIEAVNDILQKINSGDIILVPSENIDIKMNK